MGNTINNYANEIIQLWMENSYVTENDKNSLEGHIMNCLLGCTQSEIEQIIQLTKERAGIKKEASNKIIALNEILDNIEASNNRNIKY